MTVANERRSSHKKHAKFKVSLANIKCNPTMPQGHVEHDILSVWVTHSSVILWSEIEISRYWRALKGILRDKLWDHWFEPHECPISIRKNWLVNFTRIKKAHRGRPLTSPNRYLCEVVAHLPVGNDGLTPAVVFIGGHYISGAWNDKRKTFKKWRQKMWQKMYDQEAARVSHYMDKGYTIVGAHDFNRVAVPKFHPTQKWAVKHGIDQMYVIPGRGVEVDVINTGKVEHVFTDHPPIWAELELTW